MMKYPVHVNKRAAARWMTAAVITLVVTGLLESGCSRGQAADGNTPQESGARPNPSQSATSVDLLPSQLNAITIEPVGSYMFPVEKEAVGNIDFDGDLSVQVFPAYSGTIINMLVELGAEAARDQPLYTITSPDLIQAESTLIGAAATFDLTNKELARVKSLSGIAVREIEQATSDQQTADGALKAARDAVRVFGKTDAEIDQMVAARKIDPALVVRSPIAGKITSKNAQPGFFVQPGNPPAPYSVADVTIKWMLANVSESEIRFFHLSQPVQVKVTGLSRPRVQGQGVEALRDGRSEHASSHDPFRDLGSERRTTSGNARELRYSRPGPGASDGHPSERRGARRRWHDDGLGDHRSPPF